MLPRPVLDRCPGVLRPHTAADGLLVRVRQPGGRFRSDNLSALARCAAQYGAPFVQLTSRGNLQVRGLPDPVPDDFRVRLDALGLLPAPTHERVRNIVAAPDAGLDDLVTDLDAALSSLPQLAELPGRWLFALSDVSGDVLDLPFDVAYQALSPTDGVVLSAGHARPCSRADAVEALIDLATRFLAKRPNEACWNTRALPADSAYFNDLQRPAELVTPPPSRSTLSAPRPGRGNTPPGEHNAPASTLTVGVPLGLLEVDQAEALAEVAEELVVTPYRSVVLRGMSPSAVADARVRLAARGLDPDARSPQVTACIGAPYCRRTDSPTIALTRSVLPRLAVLASDGPRTHVVGCERACGAPATPHVLVQEPHSASDILTAMGHHD